MAVAPANCTKTAADTAATVRSLVVLARHMPRLSQVATTLLKLIWFRSGPRSADGLEAPVHVERVGRRPSGRAVAPGLGEHELVVVEGHRRDDLPAGR